MAAIPLIEETSASRSGVMIGHLAGFERLETPPQLTEAMEARRPVRSLAIYPASAGFEMVEELDHLAARTIEPNVFFNPRFLAPAMPRLEDKEVRLAVMRDGDDLRSRLRLLVPFTLERSSLPLGVPVMRTWSNIYGPLGTPLLDRDDPSAVLEDFLAMLSRPHLKLPRVFVFPEIRLDGAFAGILRLVATSNNLPLTVTNEYERSHVISQLDGEGYMRATLNSHRRGEFRRLLRRLQEQGELSYEVARTPEDIRAATEAFLSLEASGWKGRERTAMAVDRFRAAFAREAIDRLAELDMCRIHALRLNGRVIASLVVFVEAGIAYTWKTAFDETLSAFSPGALLMIEVTKTHLEDPNIEMTDSCAAPNHPLVGRLWGETRPIGTMVLGLTPAAERATRQVGQQLHLYRETRNVLRQVRERVRTLTRRR
ncbi:GNAT family N-acetyltransferase [Chelativorans sp. ZYF759]|uniref:GNAT family N-acetyltransferase n=1 Tax=Chelativorans sp. ZYF759 TaxID=2692213 RepID=UPI00145DCAC3|nr:GNAT family N-acetyltransferase [Chelativorans sp. ZYF759]NMG41169.1 GNAT family N-acetyltransferase [Chelativorans sp. ZYF759]